MSAKLTFTNVCISISSIWGWRAGERKDVLCNCPLSLSLSITHSKHTDQVPIWRRETHPYTLNMRVQNYHLNKKDKNGLLCFIRLGKQQKKEKKKHCADLYITDTNQPSHISHSHSHSNTFTKIFTSITNPICLIFFVVFVISFLGKCKSSSFFIIHFSIALLFI